MSCRPTLQTNRFDRLELPERLQGHVAPMVVWEYIDWLQRRVAKLEAEAAAKREHEAGHRA